LTVSLTRQTLQQLEKLRQTSGKESLADVAADAIDLYTRVRVPEDVNGLARLTPRMREVLLLVTEGYTTKEIAQQLGISVKTVEMHRTQLMKTLAIQGIAGLVRYAIRAGMILP
jgi:RNA polymerase sigma factor (sigma-70 family)